MTKPVEHGPKAEDRDEENGLITRQCKKPGCKNVFTLKMGEHGQRRVYCDIHYSGATKPPKDRKPGNLNINVTMPKPSAKGDPVLEAVERRANSIVTFVAMGLYFAGQQEDAADITKGGPEWAKALAELSEYEPWIKKLAAGGEASERVMAWFKFAMATFGLMAPVLVRHDMLPEPLKNILNLAGIEAVQMAAQQVQHEQADADPVAA